MWRQTWYDNVEKTDTNFQSTTQRECIVIYAHYDVVFADPAEWSSDPFLLTGRDGYLYGRGVSDNKGPLLASIFAVKALLDAGRLDVDVSFIIEGEEESGMSLNQRGLMELVKQHMAWFTPCRAIIISNNYWIDEATPCITYGMRGVIDLEIWVSGPSKDLHSGVDGGAVHEPMEDLTALLSSMHHPDGTLAVTGFSHGIRPISADEASRFDAVKLDLEGYTKDMGVTALKGARSTPAAARPGGCEMMKTASARLLASRWSVRE